MPRSTMQTAGKHQLAIQAVSVRLYTELLPSTKNIAIFWTRQRSRYFFLKKNMSL